jgi:flagellar basal body-associated protein FliL
MEDSQQSTEQISGDNRGSNKPIVVLLVMITLLLAAVLATGVYSIMSTNEQNELAEQRATEYQTRVKAAKEVLDSQRDIIFDIMTDYQGDVYDNPSIDRIAEQQLVAEEYQLIALQILAIQNGQVIELLAATP